MSDKVKSFFVYKKLSEIIEECRKDAGLCKELLSVLGEVGNSDELDDLVKSIEKRDMKSYENIPDVLKDRDVLNSLYNFLILL